MDNKDNKKLRLSSNQFGACLIAGDKIYRNEALASFDGETYTREDIEAVASLNPMKGRELYEHAIQIGQNLWRESRGLARYFNHSCEPNCGIKGLNTVTAMRDINEGEELTWDYSMTEDSWPTPLKAAGASVAPTEHWANQCGCGTPSCRKRVTAFGEVKDILALKHEGFISEWLVKKYDLNRMRCEAVAR